MVQKKWMRTLLALVFCITAVYLPQTALADGLPAGDDNNGSRIPDTTKRPGNGDWPTPKSSSGAGSFAGTWYAFVDNTAFTIIIEQEGRIIKGAHTAVYDYGRRVDSSVGSVSMLGTIEGSTAFMEWKSGLSPETGKATLEYIPGRPVTLHWKIAEEPPKPSDQADAGPVEVSYFLPKTAYLMRKY